MAALKKRCWFHGKKILKLNKIPDPDDIGDALACALTAFYFQKQRSISK